MDVASVKDIGTHFSIRRTEDSIMVSVSVGRVAFIERKTGETRELSAGNSLTFNIRENHFGSTELVDANGGGTQSLVFSNSPLSEVIAALQQASGKKIALSDPALGQRRLTVDLNGIALDNALKIVCASLNLEFSEAGGAYTLRQSDKGPQH
jgi:transmembrane sensor